MYYTSIIYQINDNLNNYIKFIISQTNYKLHQNFEHS